MNESEYNASSNYDTLPADIVAICRPRNNALRRGSHMSQSETDDQKKLNPHEPKPSMCTSQNQNLHNHV